jgi:hypothetical protein
MPRELILLSYLDRFGAGAVYGRALGAGELRRMAAADNLAQARRKWNENIETMPSDERRIVLRALKDME